MVPSVRLQKLQPPLELVRHPCNCLHKVAPPQWTQRSVYVLHVLLVSVIDIEQQGLAIRDILKWSSVASLQNPIYLKESTQHNTLANLFAKVTASV